MKTKKSLAKLAIGVLAISLLSGCTTTEPVSNPSFPYKEETTTETFKDVKGVEKLPNFTVSDSLNEENGWSIDLDMEDPSLNSLIYKNSNGCTLSASSSAVSTINGTGKDDFSLSKSFLNASVKLDKGGSTSDSIIKISTTSGDLDFATTQYTPDSVSENGTAIPVDSNNTSTALIAVRIINSPVEIIIPEGKFTEADRNPIVVPDRTAAEEAANMPDNGVVPLMTFKYACASSAFNEEEALKAIALIKIDVIVDSKSK